MVTQYNFYWIPMDGKYILPSKREFIGVYTTISACQTKASDLRRNTKYKNREGMFMRNKVGTSEFIGVM